MSEIHSRLGRGLGSMVTEVSTIRAGSAPTGGGYVRLPFSEIAHMAGGRGADDALIESVKKYGVLQPVLVAREEGNYRLLAGSRRLAAAKAAGLADVPALVVPPDRAGGLDVYLEENLARTGLSETEREHLRQRWMRETGRDAALASERIPAASAELVPAKLPSARNWIIATSVLSVLCIVLVLMVLNARPVDRRTVVIPVEFVEQPAESVAGPVDNRWMDAFVFPGCRREIQGSALALMFGDALLSGGKPTPRGELVLNQLAAVAGNAGRKLTIELAAAGADANAAAGHLVREGIGQDQIVVKTGGSADSLNVLIRAN